MKTASRSLTTRGIRCLSRTVGQSPAAIDVNAMIDDNRAKKASAEAAKRERDEISVKFKALDGLDPDAVVKALEVAKQVEDGKLLEAGHAAHYLSRVTAEQQQRILRLEGVHQLGGSIRGYVTEKVSGRAAENPFEFVVEVFAGLMDGKTYDEMIMRMFRGYEGVW